MVFNTVGSIATHISSKMFLPVGVSGGLVDTVDLQRIKVQNYIGETIPSTAIPEAYQDIITDFSKADALEEAFMWSSTVAISGGEVLISDSSSVSSVGGMHLGDFNVSSKGSTETTVINFLSNLSKETPVILRKTAQASLENLGQSLNFYKSNG